MEMRNDGSKFKDLGGMRKILDEIKIEVFLPLFQPLLLRHFGCKPRTILLHGPSGCGKTKLAHAIANETGISFYPISASELVSEGDIKELFAKACRSAPSIIFIDEIDAIALKREDFKCEMDSRNFVQLMTCLDELNRFLRENDVPVILLGATNKLNAIDSAFRRSGRFDKEIYISHPDESGRNEILHALTSNHNLDDLFDLQKIARATIGFVGSELAELVDKAAELAMVRITEERRPLSAEQIGKPIIKRSDFEEASKKVLPLLRREGFFTLPDVKWKDVVGLDLLKEEFERHIVNRIKYPEECERLGVGQKTGFLLYGPPGCGKKLIAKAVASEAGASFVHIKGPEFLNKYAGEGEQAVQTLFSRARTCAPCILLFDEVDVLTRERGGGDGVSYRMTSRLFTELDEAGHERSGVFVIGATNRSKTMDHAFIWRGKLGKRIHVPLPSPEERVLILKALARNSPIDATLDLSSIARMEACENLSGSDLAALVNEAAMAAFEEKDTTIKSTHFEVALSKVSRV